MTARPARKQQPVPSSAEKCAVGGGTCGEPMAARCSWAMHEVDSEGAKKFSGAHCDLKLCEKHAHRVGKGVLCLWHRDVAVRAGYVKEE